MDCVKLIELKIHYSGSHNYDVISRADDIFSALRECEEQLPKKGEIIEVRLLIYFTNYFSPRIAILHSKDGVLLDHSLNADIIEHWMERRGFIIGAEDGTLG